MIRSDISTKSFMKTPECLPKSFTPWQNILSLLPPAKSLRMPIAVSKQEILSDIWGQGSSTSYARLIESSLRRKSTLAGWKKQLRDKGY